jgi:hypothetical protein
MVYVYVYYGGYAVHAAGEHSDAVQTAKYVYEECSLEATGHYEVPVRFPAIALQWRCIDILIVNFNILYV